MMSSDALRASHFQGSFEDSDDAGGVLGDLDSLKRSITIHWMLSRPKFRVIDWKYGNFSISC